MEIATHDDISPRPEVVRFAKLMEQKLRKNDHKLHWSNSSIEHLIARLEQELQELRTEYDSYAVGQAMPKDLSGACSKYQWHEVEQEAIDIANFAMMISDNLRRIIPPENSGEE